MIDINLDNLTLEKGNHGIPVFALDAKCVNWSID
jgi:hypothetical protein